LNHPFPAQATPQSPGADEAKDAETPARDEAAAPPAADKADGTPCDVGPLSPLADTPNQTPVRKKHDDALMEESITSFSP